MMKKPSVITVIYIASALMCQAQVVLTEGTYMQDFNSMGNGAGPVSMPAGWSMTINATAASLGTLQTTAGRAVWATTTYSLKNYASTAGLTSSASSSDQNSSTNRALGIRQTASAGDPGAAFVFNFSTIGTEITSISFDFLTLDVQARQSIYVAQVSTNGTSWTTLTTSPVQVSDADVWGSSTVTISTIPVEVRNVPNAYFRLFASTASTGIGSRDSIAIDNFSMAVIPEPSTWVLIGIGSGLLLWRSRRRNSLRLKPNIRISN